MKKTKYTIKDIIWEVVKDFGQSFGIAEDDLKQIVTILMRKGLKAKVRGRKRSESVFKLLEKDFINLFKHVKTDDLKNKLLEGQKELEKFIDRKASQIIQQTNMNIVKDIGVLLEKVDKLTKDMDSFRQKYDLSLNLTQKILTFNMKNLKKGKVRPTNLESMISKPSESSSDSKKPKKRKPKKRISPKEKK